MQCWRCSGQVVNGICTLCGCREGDRKPAVTENGRMLRYVYDKFGARRTLTEDGLMVRCLADVLPDEIELRRALTAAFAAGAGQEFYAVLETNQPLTEAIYQGLVRVLEVAELAEDDARAVLVTLWDMAGCGVPQSSLPPQLSPEPAPVTPRERPMQEQSRQIQPEISRQPGPVAGQTLASLGNVVLADATHGLNAMKGNGRSGMLFLRSDGVAMHHYERQIGISRNRSWHQAPDIFIPMQAIDRVIIHDSGLTYDFTLALKDGVRFQTISSTYGYNRKGAKQFVALLQEQLAKSAGNGNEMKKPQAAKKKAGGRELFFQGKGIINVTNHVMKSFSDAGYMCSCDVLIYRDGQIELIEDDGSRELLERLSVQQIISANDHMNSYDPIYTRDVLLVTEEKTLHMSFYNEDAKKKFWDAILAVSANKK